MHEVAVLAMQGFVPFDLTIPCEVFGRLRKADGTSAYNVVVCSEAGSVHSGAFSLRAPCGLDRLSSAQTVVIPGIEDVSKPVPKAILNAIIAAWSNGARITSICSGAFVLAATGLLNGRRATTHWLAARELALRFPKIKVDPLVLYVDEGQILTSAGATAGIDLCLHLIRRDYGQAMAAQAARFAVAPLDREGGQAQFIRHKLPESNATLAPLLLWMQENAHLQLEVIDLAKRARLSPRTFARRFHEQTGTTPLQWLINIRILRAQELLETTSIPIEEIALASGFEAAVSFRTRFTSVVGVNPTAYRRNFNANVVVQL
jgi:transcriptional regulator GlxA family with amidase domain